MAHELRTRRILDRVAESNSVSQRSLSRELGIALGLTNLLLRRLTAKGWIRIVRIRPNHVRYVLTPAGFAQQARLSRDYFLRSVQFYSEARDRVQHRLAEMLSPSSAGRHQSVVFYGAGEVAEVGWVCVQRTPLRLVGVVDDERSGRDFFGQTVLPVSALNADRCNEVPYDRLIVMAMTGIDPVRALLDRAGVQGERVFWL